MDVTLKSGKLTIRACHDTLSLRYPTDMDILTCNLNYPEDLHTTNDKKNLNFRLNILIGHSVSDLYKEKKYSDVTY